MRRTKRGGWPYSQSPNIQFEINRASPQADGLVLWMPWGGGTPGTHRHVDRVSDLVFTEGGTPVWVADGERGHSLLFDDAANEYLENASAIISSSPFTFAAQFRSDVLWLQQDILTVGDTGGNNNSYGIGLTGEGTPYYYARAAGNNSVAWAAVGYSVDTWHHLCGIEYAANSHACLLDGGNKGTNAVNRLPAGLDTTRIGVRADLAKSNYFSGRLSDIRIYDRALTDTEVWQLYAEPWELYKPLIQRWMGWKSPVTVRIPRYGFTNFQVPGIV